MEPLKKRAKCQHGRQRNKCKECGGASICQHGRQRSECKECASVFIGRTVAKQTVGHSVCEGTVVSFTTAGSKYRIEYTDGTTAALTKTAIMEVLSPPPMASTAAETDVASAIIGRTAAGDGISTATEANTEVPPEDETCRVSYHQSLAE